MLDDGLGGTGRLADSRISGFWFLDDGGLAWLGGGILAGNVVKLSILRFLHFDV